MLSKHKSTASAIYYFKIILKNVLCEYGIVMAASLIIDVTSSLLTETGNKTKPNENQTIHIGLYSVD